METYTLSNKDKAIKAIIIILIVFVTLIVLVPLLYVLAASFMDPTALINKGISFDVKDWSFEGYKRVFQDSAIIRGFINSLLYSLIFGILNVVITMTAAFSLAQKDLVFRKGFNIFFIITMFFGGGLVPTYLLIKNLNMLDSPLALLLPGCLSVWNLILARVYIQGLPNELYEAAKIDGANDLQIFAKVVIPLCKPIMFVIFLYSFVGMWNGYFDAMIYIKSPSLEPLQLVLRRILVQNQPNMQMIGDQVAMAELKRLAELIKYSTIVISSLPLIIMYPFFQKYFDKGVVMGSLKG
ncbi:carbohydrate ABC transporter permease [Helcococcus kunzii]|uniref:carbohydrate ABC transporter permease n=1 Tax=Helcococcus kunzii TaxID=40091 RepID=UPI0038A92EE5